MESWILIILSTQVQFECQIFISNSYLNVRAKLYTYRAGLICCSQCTEYCSCEFNPASSAMIFQTDERARHSGAEPYSGADRDARRADGATNARGGPAGACASQPWKGPWGGWSAPGPARWSAPLRLPRGRLTRADGHARCMLAVTPRWGRWTRARTPPTLPPYRLRPAPPRIPLPVPAPPHSDVPRLTVAARLLQVQRGTPGDRGDWAGPDPTEHDTQTPRGQSATLL